MPLDLGKAHRVKKAVLEVEDGVTKGNRQYVQVEPKTLLSGDTNEEGRYNEKGKRNKSDDG